MTYDGVYPDCPDKDSPRYCLRYLPEWEQVPLSKRRYLCTCCWAEPKQTIRIHTATLINKVKEAAVNAQS